MSYYKYDKKTLEKIREINDKISKDQQQIFDILLKISQSFADESFSKEKRNELFNQVDILKQNIKDYNEKLKEIKLKKSDESKKADLENENTVDEVESVEFEQTENKNDEFVDTVEKLEDTLKETENKTEKEEITFSKRKKARTQLVVVEDDESLSGKIKDFFSRLRRMIKK